MKVILEEEDGATKEFKDFVLVATSSDDEKERFVVIGAVSIVHGSLQQRISIIGALSGILHKISGDAEQQYEEVVYDLGERISSLEAAIGEKEKS